MSHSVTVTRTVTTSNNTSALVINTGYVKTLPGLLKLAQLVSRDWYEALDVDCGFVAYFYLCSFPLDSWCNLYWIDRRPLWTIQLGLSWNSRSFLFADGNNILCGNILSAGLLFIFTQYRWHHLKNDLCNCHFTNEFSREHFLIFSLFHFKLV